MGGWSRPFHLFKSREELHMRCSTAWLCAVAVVAMASAAREGKAPSPINAPGAMQPSTGTAVMHEMFLYRDVGSNPTNNETGANELAAITQIAYGVAHNFALQFDAPLVYRDVRLAGGGGESEFNIADMTLLAK